MNDAKPRQTEWNAGSLAGCIDQTLLTATATESDAEAFCREAAGFGFASVCLNPVFVPLAASVLRDSAVRVCTVVDFPLGAGGFSAKEAQAKTCIRDGAEELDFVVDLGLVKSRRWADLENRLSALNEAVKTFSASLWAKEPARKSRAGLPSVITKLILETCWLSDEEITGCCRCAVTAGMDFVKTSTGFAVVKDAGGALLPNGATVRHVRLMREAVGSVAGVKASGGIRKLPDALAMLEAGATRIGTSSGVRILRELDTLER